MMTRIINVFNGEAPAKLNSNQKIIFVNYVPCYTTPKLCQHRNGSQIIMNGGTHPGFVHLAHGEILITQTVHRWGTWHVLDSYWKFKELFDISYFQVHRFQIVFGSAFRSSSTYLTSEISYCYQYVPLSWKISATVKVCVFLVWVIDNRKLIKFWSTWAEFLRLVINHILQNYLDVNKVNEFITVKECCVLELGWNVPSFAKLTEKNLKYFSGRNASIYLGIFTNISNNS